MYVVKRLDCDGTCSTIAVYETFISFFLTHKSFLLLQSCLELELFVADAGRLLQDV